LQPPDNQDSSSRMHEGCCNRRCWRQQSHFAVLAPCLVELA
jgi:hypothetical protein